MAFATKVNVNLIKQQWHSYPLYHERQITGFISIKRHLSWIRNAVDEFYENTEPNSRALEGSKSCMIQFDIPFQIFFIFVSLLKL